MSIGYRHPSTQEGPQRANHVNETDDGIEVRGLDVLNSGQGASTSALLGSPASPPSEESREPEMLRLLIRYRGEEYIALMARTLDGARRLGDIPHIEDWMRCTPGWWVIVSGPHGRHFTAPFPTVAAAVLAALLLPQSLHSRREHALSQWAPQVSGGGKDPHSPD
jgi:hypothetical protein